MTRLVLAILLAVYHQLVEPSSAWCPDMCTCTENTTRASCENFTTSTTANMTLLPENLQVLHLSNVNVSRLNFTDDLSLRELTITQSVIPEEFSVPPSLHVLRLCRNVLDRVNFNSSQLKELDLSHNSVALNDSSFRTLQLELLNLSANAIAEVFPHNFIGIVNLKCLDLSHNRLTQLRDAFRPLSSLQFLNLSHNRLEVLNLSSLLRLQRLDVSYNSLVRIESLQLPSLARLLLAGNRQLGESSLMGTGTKLQAVDASRIGLKQVPAALTHSIRSLRLSGNAIRNVICGDLDFYPLLQLLDFTSNTLEHVEDDALGRLDSLTILYLSSNSIRDVPKSLPEKLKVLHLEHNSVERITSKDFQNLAALEVLLLNDNSIGTVEEEAFATLNALVTLDLSRNPIKTLGCLSGPQGLQVLRLSDVRAVVKESFPLSFTEHLVVLDLSRSPGLARRLLQDTAVLAATRELQELDLTKAQVECIRSDLLHFLPQLRTLHIGENSINCTQLQWLATWMRRQNLPEYRSVTCSSPPELWGTPLIDLQDSIEPPPSTTTTTTTTTPSTTTASTTTASTTTPPTTTLPTTAPPPATTTKKSMVLIGEMHNIDSTLAQDTPTSETTTTTTSTTTTTTRTTTTSTAGTTAAEPKDIPYQWNTSALEMSVFSASRKDSQPPGMLHPGMLILALGILGAATLVVVLSRRFAKKRKLPSEEESLEENLPNATELW